MKASLNLRNDLVALGDAELAERLKACWDSYEAAGVTPPKWFSINVPLLYSFRGPIRHRRAYRFLMGFFSGANNIWLALLFATMFSISGGAKRLTGDPTTDAHLSLCEIRDIIDEIGRRVKQKQAKP